MKSYLKFFSVSTIFLTVGCTGSNIDSVKSDYVDPERTMNFSQLLDKRSVCEKITWSEFKDKNDRTIVEYQCEFKNSKDHLKSSRENYINSLSGSRTFTFNTLKSDYEEIEARYKSDYPILTERLSKLTAEYQTMTNLVPGPSPELISLKKSIGDIDSLIKNFSESKANELLFSDSLPRVLSNELRLIAVPLGSSLRSLAERPREQQAKYKKDNVDVYYNEMREKLGGLRARAQNAYNAEVAEIDSRRKRELEDLQEKIKSVVDEKSEKQMSDEGRLKELSEQIASYQHDDGESKLKERGLKKYPVYTKIVETFQWILNNEKVPLLTYGEVTAHPEAGEPVQMLTYRQPHKVLPVIARSSSDNFRVYFKEIDAHAMKMLMEN